MRTPDENPMFLTFSRPEWADLRLGMPLPLAADSLDRLAGLNEPITMAEIEEVYLPLSRFLSLHVSSVRNLDRVRDAFLRQTLGDTPYIIGVAGSVASGKSTLARLLQALVSEWPDRPSVEIVTTDGFLHPTHVLQERGLMARKGFPESYDRRRMIDFLREVKQGKAKVIAPRYSHLSYDIVPDEYQVVRRPDVLIFEGLNVLGLTSDAPVVASDFFDFSIYLDAEMDDLEQWFVARRRLLQKTAFRSPDSYFYDQRNMPEDEARRTAHEIWRSINRPNLQENILPTRRRADLVLHKGSDHRIDEVWLRR